MTLPYHLLTATAALYHADARDALRALPADSLDSCVTDPPYALVSIVKRFGGANAAPAKGNDAYMRASAGFMGKQWDTGECAMDPEFWAEVLRVLKPGAHLVAFGASRGYHRMACAIEDAGFEIRDSLAWLYGTGFPKSHAVDKGIDKHLGVEGSQGAPRLLPNGKEHHFNIGYENGEGYDAEKAGRFSYVSGSDAAREWEGWGTALKSAFEPIVLARKPLSEGTVAANVLRWRTGALNIDACRVGTEGATKRSAQTAYADSGWRTGHDIVTLDMGRWPANVVHDGSDEVIGAFPSAGGQQGRAREGGDKKGSIYGTFSTNTTRNPEPRNDSGSAARFFYSAKASKADRAGSKHPTVKPIALMEWLCQLVTPPGGTVLDPFAGSGTTGAATMRTGHNVVLIEREAEYVADIRARFASPGIVPDDSN